MRELNKLNKLFKGVLPSPWNWMNWRVPQLKMCHNNWGPYVIWKDVWIGKSVSTVDYLKQNVKRVHVVTSLIKWKCQEMFTGSGASSSCSDNLCKIHRKALVLGYLSRIFEGWITATLLLKKSGAGVVLRLLQNFSELLCGCFWSLYYTGYSNKNFQKRFFYYVYVAGMAVELK